VSKKRTVTKRRNCVPVNPWEGVLKDLLAKQPPPRSDYEEQTLEGGQKIIAHKASACRQDKTRKTPRPCPIHGRTMHHMRAWPQNWRDDKGVMERQCPHGIGHPDPDDPKTGTAFAIHGCDGCCRPPA
jgi:hypothetical protein